MNTYYIEMRVWRRLDKESAVLYRCLKCLGTQEYAVQSADFFRLPFDRVQIEGSERQFLELSTEVEPIERCRWFVSLEAAVENHNLEFGLNGGV
jgi:hypothetical protein